MGLQLDRSHLWEKYLKFLTFIFYLCVCVRVCRYSWKQEDNVEVPEIGIAGDCQLPSGCLELNPGSLQEQSVLTAEPHF